LSDRRSPAPRSPAAPPPGGLPDHPSPALVPLGLAAVLALVIWVAASQLHLQAAVRLASLFGPPLPGPSPWPQLAAEQLGKLIALGGLAALAGSAMLLLLHLPHSRCDRQLTARMAGLLGAGGALYLALDIAPMLGLVPPGQGRVLVAIAEETVQWSTLGAATLLLARRCLRRPDEGEPSGRAPPWTRCTGALPR